MLYGIASLEAVLPQQYITPFVTVFQRICLSLCET